MSSILSLLVLAAVVGCIRADSFCEYTASWDDKTHYEWCAYGCCTEYADVTDDPCCGIYTYPGFIAGVVIGSIVLVVAVVVALLCRRRRLLATTVTYGQSGGPSVISTTATSQQMGIGGGGYGNPGFMASNSSNTVVRY
ncbi:uncharacterized protein LOC101854553 [Aplysia californica]|uniref:Uncharacterized protein LOC101854553 n=1 Tax=Aplysia californica TaxID=6500 RepID=A0ABM0JGE6_APLCA|nr:uncharacterized protein LOC101854553 [Aplysia californica]